jgi:hypothetical protein
MNATATTAASKVAHEEPLEPGVHPQLQSWHEGSERLAFVYSRSMGSLIATGWATVAGMDSKFLRLRTSDGHMLITTVGATFSTEPQRFFSADLLRSHLVPGLSLQLASHDWLFLSSSASPEVLSLPQGGSI